MQLGAAVAGEEILRAAKQGGGSHRPFWTRSRQGGEGRGGDRREAPWNEGGEGHLMELVLHAQPQAWGCCELLACA